MSEGKRACVIGAGLGGLALAIRLQAAGVATTVVEARADPGGRALAPHRDGFVFDAGAAIVDDPAALHALWGITGHSLADDLELLPVEPLWRLAWPDGATLDLSGDWAALRRDIARIEPGDAAGAEAFARYAATVEEDIGLGREAAPSPALKALARAAPAIVRHQAWHGIHEMAARFVRHEKVRQALSFHALLAGADPMTAGPLRVALRPPERDRGAWWPRGGADRLAAAMARHFERLGGELRLGDPAAAIETLGVRCTEVVTAGGWRGKVHAVASTADLVHTYRDLLGRTMRGKQTARRLASRRFGPALFAVHFGVEGTWPGIPHRTVLFGPRYQALMEDIFDHGVLPADTLAFLHHPSITDPGVAPPGRSAFSALVPVPHLGKLAVDWAQVGPVLESRVLAEVSRRLIPDLEDRIVTRFHCTPAHIVADFGPHLGSLSGPEPAPGLAAPLRARHRDEVIENLYLPGTGAQRQAGVAGAIAGANATAAAMLEDMER